MVFFFVQTVQVVQAVQTPFFILPRGALIVTHNPYGWRLGVKLKVGV